MDGKHVQAFVNQRRGHIVLRTQGIGARDVHFGPAGSHHFAQMGSLGFQVDAQGHFEALERLCFFEIPLDPVQQRHMGTHPAQFELSAFPQVDIFDVTCHTLFCFELAKIAKTGGISYFSLSPWVSEGLNAHEYKLSNMCNRCVAQVPLSSGAGFKKVSKPAPAICLYTHVKAHFHGAGSDTIFKPAPVRWGTCTTCPRSLHHLGRSLRHSHQKPAPEERRIP